MSLCLQLLAAIAVGQLQAAYRAWDAAVSAKLDAQLAAIRAAGEPVHPAEMAKLYPEVPPGENAAELYLSAFRLAGDVHEQLGNLDMDLPVFGVNPTVPLDQPLDQELLEASDSYLAHYREVFRLLGRAMDKADCRFDVDFSKGPRYLVPVLTDWVCVSRLCWLQALVRAEHGQAGKAAESLCTALRACSVVADMPWQMTVALAAFRRDCTTDSIEEMVNRTTLPEPALAALQEELKRSIKPQRMYLCLVGERCAILARLRRDYIRRNAREIIDAIIGPELFPGYSWARLHLVGVLCLPAYSRAEASAYADVMARGIRAARLPYPQCLIEGAKLEAGERDPFLSVSRTTARALRLWFEDMQRSRAKCDSARAALACLRYEAEKGRLPGALELLVPRYIDAVPVDPFDAKPLRYRRIKDGCVVYAVGQNGKDDGGETDTAWEDGDIGFRVVRPRTRP